MQRLSSTIAAFVLVLAIACSSSAEEKKKWGEQQVTFFSINCPQPSIVIHEEHKPDTAYASPYMNGEIRFGRTKIYFSALAVKGNDYNPGPCRDHTFLRANKYTIENQNVNNLQSRIAYVEEGQGYLAELCCSNERFDKQLYLFADSLNANELATVLDVFKSIKFSEGE